MLEIIKSITYEKIVQNNVINNIIYNIISNHSNKKKCIKKIYEWYKKTFQKKVVWYKKICYAVLIINNFSTNCHVKAILNQF